MAAPLAILGFLNPNSTFGFAQTAQPMSYIQRLRDGIYNSRWIDPEAQLMWAVPAHDRDEATTLRDRWNHLQLDGEIDELPEFSVPMSIVEILRTLIPSADRSPSFDVDGLALELISRHGTIAALATDADEEEESASEVPPHTCPFVPTTDRVEPSQASDKYHFDRNIKLAIFDLDMTLVDTSRLRKARDERNWSQVRMKMRDAAALPCWGGCAAHQLPQILAEQGVSVALVSRAPEWYVKEIADRFEIYFDYLEWACGWSKETAFQRTMDEFDVTPGSTVVFGDDSSDFLAAERLSILSLGNPWTSCRADAAPDVAWIDATTLLNEDDWNALRYVGEAKPGNVTWHRGSLLPFGDDAYALGRYFPSRRTTRHQDPLTRSVLDGKRSPYGVALTLDAFETAIHQLAAKTNIDSVVGVPAHPGRIDRFEAYRDIATDLLDASDDVGVLPLLVPEPGYKTLGAEAMEELERSRYGVTSDLEGQTVLLIDDVVTTGSTLRALKHAVEKAGAERVVQIAFAFNQR